MGMIMLELTSGCKPFANVEHNTDLIYEIIDGKRPEIASDTPECFANLMKECWDSNPLKRPSAVDICDSISKWSRDVIAGAEQFKQAEKKRLELIQLKKLGPEFSEKSHSKAIFTSRNLSSLISKSSTNSSFISDNGYKSLIKKSNNKGNFRLYLFFLNLLLTYTNLEIIYLFLEYITKEYDLVIDTQR